MGIEVKRVSIRRTNCDCSMPGVWRALSFVRGAVVIFHSPRPCAHIAHGMDVSSCAAGLIGDDIEAIARGAGLACPVVALDSSGLAGSFADGWDKAAHAAFQTIPLFAPKDYTFIDRLSCNIFVI